MAVRHFRKFQTADGGGRNLLQLDWQRLGVSRCLAVKTPLAAGLLHLQGQLLGYPGHQSDHLGVGKG